MVALSSEIFLKKMMKSFIMVKTEYLTWFKLEHPPFKSLQPSNSNRKMYVSDWRSVAHKKHTPTASGYRFVVLCTIKTTT